MAGDVADLVHCRALVARAVKAFGRLDILVNNAAYQMTFQSLDEISEQEWDKTVPHQHPQHVLSREGGGAAPEAGQRNRQYQLDQRQIAEPASAPSATTKGAIGNFTAGLARLLAKQGIRVNCVAPEPIWTPLIPSTMAEESVENFGKNTPLERPGQPAEVTPPYILLASNDGSYNTGAMIPATCGRPML